MQNNYYSIYPCINIYERPITSSKISSQIIYGEKFKVLKKLKNFLKIKTFYDKYYGYIKKKKFIKKIILSLLMVSIIVTPYLIRNFINF